MTRRNMNMSISKLKKRSAAITGAGSVLAVVNAFLPAFRKTRGRIVQISTMTATLPFPFNCPSGASKAAFDALAAVYRTELKPFGAETDLKASPGGNLFYRRIKSMIVLVDHNDSR